MIDLRKTAIGIMTAVFMISGAVTAYAGDNTASGTAKMSYDQGSGMYIGTFYTKDTPECVEIYTTAGYLDNGGAINMIVGDNGVYTLTKDGLSGGDPTGKVSIEYGATLELTQYPMDCHVIYAAVPEEAAAVRWGISFSGAGTLINEALVVDAEIPDRETVESGVVSTQEPEGMLSYFISSEGAKISPEQVEGIISSYVAVDSEGNVTDLKPSGAGEGNVVNMTTILLLIGFVVLVVCAYIFYSKRQQKIAAMENKEKRIAEKNGKIEAQKEAEGDQIKEYMQTKINTYKDYGFDDGFDDDEEEVKDAAIDGEGSMTDTSDKSTGAEKGKQEAGKTTCPNCGAEVSNEYRHCPECGSEIGGKEDNNGTVPNTDEGAAGLFGDMMVSDDMDEEEDGFSKITATVMEEVPPYADDPGEEEPVSYEDSVEGYAGYEEDPYEEPGEDNVTDDIVSGEDTEKGNKISDEAEDNVPGENGTPRTPKFALPGAEEIFNIDLSEITAKAGEENSAPEKEEKKAGEEPESPADPDGNKAMDFKALFYEETEKPEKGKALPEFRVVEEKTVTYDILPGIKRERSKNPLRMEIPKFAQKNA